MSHPIPNDALDADLAILAQKGAGKTYTAKGIVEWLLSQGARVLVVDPLSVWWGLKAGAEGEGEGYPVAVFGGPHGDMPLSEAMAEPLARTLSHANLPAVLDVAFMKKAEQMRFCAKLFETLFAENRDPLTLVLALLPPGGPHRPHGAGIRLSSDHDHATAGTSAQGYPHPSGRPDCSEDAASAGSETHPRLVHRQWRQGICKACGIRPGKPSCR